MEIKEQKKELRKKIKQQFASLSKESLVQKSENVLEQLKAIACYREAELVLAFVSMKDEISTDSILKDVLLSGKKLAVPKVTGDDLVFYLIEDMKKDLAPGAFGISEPVAGLVELDMKKIQACKTVILVPGVAFDIDNYRLGRGKGFYDRFFTILPCNVTKIGICCDFQVVSLVPREPHDKKLDKVISSHLSFQ